MPQAAPSPMPAAPPVASASTANPEGVQTFSAVLEKASSPRQSAGIQADESQGTSRGDGPAVHGTTRREAKSSDSRASDGKGRSSISGEKPLPSPVASDKIVPVAVAPPALSWNAGKDLKGDTTSSANAAIDSTSGVEAAGSLAGATQQENAFQVDSTGSTGPTAADGTAQRDGVEDSTLPTVTKSAVSSSALTELPTSDSKPQPGGATQPHDSSHGRADISDDREAQSGAKVDSDPLAVPLSGVAATLLSPAPAPLVPTPWNLEIGNAQGTQGKPGLDAPRGNSTDDVTGTTRKNVDASGGAKAQSRRDDSTSSTSSSAADQGGGIAPAKPTDASPSFAAAFSLAGTQPSATGADGKNVSLGSSSDASDRQASHLSQDSMGATQSQAQVESPVAYPTSLVNSARLVERMGESELRLGIRAGEFGSVDIRTSMIHSQFTAEISTEHGELGRALAAELPSLQSRLTEQRVAVANITLQNHSDSHSTASEQQKSNDGRQVYATTPASGRDESVIPAFAAFEVTEPASRLDIHM